jgi:hypothetical protein
MSHVRAVQITGTGDFTKIGLPEGDQGGEMDSHGADDLSNPVGGIVYTTANPATNGEPFFVSEWTNFMSHNQYCMRACWGDDARERCQHIYDGESPPPAEAKRGVWRLKETVGADVK